MSAICFFALLALASSVRGHEGHRCAHSEVASQHKIYHIPQFRKESPVPQSRGAEEQSTTFPPNNWHTIRLMVNYTFAEDPSLDAYANGGARTCSYAGQNIPIGGEVASSSIMCLDANGDAVYQNYCYLTCRGQDVVNKTSLAQSGSSLQKLKAAIDAVLTKYASVLAVPDVTPDAVTVSADLNTNNCGDLIIPPTTVSNVDFVMMVTLRPLQYLGPVVAFARACALDGSTSRPILGHTNVAPATLLNNPDLETVLLHEFTHAFGFSPSLFKFLRHPNNRALTYWQYSATQYPNGSVSGDGIRNAGAGDITIDYTLLGPGKKLFLVTPNVVSYAKSFFGCSSLTGVELENGGGTSASTASHWEKRILFYEIMGATQNLQPGVLSGFTLSYLADTGFYQVNMSAATPMSWGKGEGCGWATGRCDTAWDARYFCTKPRDESLQEGGQCGYDRRWTGYCNLVTFVSALPIPYQYFSATANGGYDELPDRCPIVTQFADTGDGRGNCLNPNNYPINDNYFGVMSGPSSRCFMSSVVDNDRVVAASAAGCYNVICVGGTVPHVRIGDAYYPCNSDDEVFELLQQTRQSGSGAGASNPLPPTSQYANSFLSYAKKGVFSCGPRVMALCDGTATSSYAWPTLSAVSPSTGLTTGGDWITITGANLATCYGVTLGGQWVYNLTKLSATQWTANVPPAGSDDSVAGPASDGEGPVMAELWCNISGSCPGGCAVHRIAMAFNYTVPVTQPFSAVDWFMNFIDTTVGKAVGAAVGVILLILLIIAIKSCCSGGNNHDAKDAKKGGKGSPNRSRHGGEPKGMLHAPAPMSPRDAPRMRQYEEDLL